MSDNEILDSSNFLVKENCPWGCLFFMDGRLAGDCRLPESDMCALKKKPEKPPEEDTPLEFPYGVWCERAEGNKYQ